SLRFRLRKLPGQRWLDQTFVLTICQALPAALWCGMTNRIRIIPHDGVPKCGSFEVRFPDGRPSRYFYWDDTPGRRIRPDVADSATALRNAQSFARAEQDKPDSE